MTTVHIKTMLIIVKNYFWVVHCTRKPIIDRHLCDDAGILIILREMISEVRGEGWCNALYIIFKT